MKMSEKQGAKSKSTPKYLASISTLRRFLENKEKKKGIILLKRNLILVNCLKVFHCQKSNVSKYLDDTVLVVFQLINNKDKKYDYY